MRNTAERVARFPRRSALFLVGLWLFAPFALEDVAARVYSPRVLSPHNADAYSMKTFRRFARWRHLTGDALAWEVYKYLADTRTGLFHMNQVLEGDDTLSEFRTVRDPVKIINVYGYGYCYILGPVLAGVCEGIGLGPARTLSLPGWKHVAAEVFYEGQWHYLDVDVRAVFRRPDGRLASLQEARTDPSLWTGRGPLFFPKDPLQRTRRVYETTAVLYYHDFYQSGHTLDFVLRQGERFTRWWTPQGGRWHHLPEYNRNSWLRRLLEKPPRGPKPNHRDFSVHNYGNGCFVYEPNLRRPSTDFEDGALDFANVRPAEDGLRLVGPGEGYAVFEVRSPYVIVPLVGDLDTTDDDREASVLEVDASGVTVQLSLDNGLTWQTVGTPAGSARFDLTRFVSGRYGYWLRLNFPPGRTDAVVRRLKLTTWVQVAPAALPSLRRGENRMQLVVGDHYGLSTRVFEWTSNTSRPEGFFKYLEAPPQDYDPARKTARIRGDVTVRIDSPRGTRIAWFRAEGSFRTHQGPAAARTRNWIAFAVDDSTRFRTVYKADVPTYTNHWHYNAHAEVRLDEPARTLRVRFHGDPAFNNFRIYTHCVDERPWRPSPVVVTHVWTENGRQRSHTVRLERPGPYVVSVDGDPQDVSVELSVPSR